MKKKKLVASITTLAIAGTIAAAIPAFAATTSNSPDTTSQTQNSQHVHKGHHKRGYGMLKQVATVIGVDAKTLKEGLKSGQSIVEIAQTKGNKVSEEVIIQHLKQNLKERLDKKVAAGKVTKEKATQILSKSDTRLKKFVNKKTWFQHKKTKGEAQPGQQAK